MEQETSESGDAALSQDKATETPVTDNMAEQAEQIAESAFDLFAEAAVVLERLSQPWALYQLGIIIALILISLLGRMALRPPLLRQAEAQSAWPDWAISILQIITARLHLIVFTALAFLTFAVMQDLLRWPERSYLVGMAARIALAWLIIAILANFIGNRTVRKLVSWGAWAFATLSILGVWDETAGYLEAASFGLGTFRISLMMILTAAVTLGVLFALAGVFNRSAQSRIASAPDMSPSIKVLLSKVAQILVYSLAFFLGLSAIGFDLSNLAILSGAIGLGLGFGLQKIVSNLVSGVIILLDKSIKPGDVISLGDTFGWITQLGARYASVTTRDGREHLIPNEDFVTSRVVNWTHSSDYVRLDIHFGVAYSSDPHFVKMIATDAPKGVTRVVEDPAPVCHIINFGDSSIDFKLRFWIKDPTAGLTNIRGNVYLALWDALEANNIEIPYPRRDVHMFGGDAKP